MSRSVLAGVLALVVALVVLAGCTGQQGGPAIVTPSVTIAEPGISESEILSIPEASLNDTERADITYLLEEEKLEHDLNNALANQHSYMRVFRSIADATQVYRAADTVILTRYGIASPERAGEGVFTNPKLQGMYSTGTSTGMVSAQDALNVSTGFEEMHVADLSTAIGRTDNDDLKFVYHQELAYSRNALRALSRWFAAYGWNYTPVYLSQDSWNGIVGTPPEALPVK
jgi:hypothetical protein